MQNCKADDGSLLDVANGKCHMQECNWRSIWWKIASAKAKTVVLEHFKHLSKLVIV